MQAPLNTLQCAEMALLCILNTMGHWYCIPHHIIIGVTTGHAYMQIEGSVRSQHVRIELW